MNFEFLPFQSPIPDNLFLNAADLVMGGQKQHRDLFTGSVGLPNVQTHVGSVVHAFETMALGVADTKAPQSRLIPGPVKLSASQPIIAPPPPSKPEKKFYKFPNNKEGVRNRSLSSSPARKITLAAQSEPQLANNPLSSGTMIRFDQQHHHQYHHPRPVDLSSPNQSDYDTATLGGDYRKHFHDTITATDRNESHEEEEDNDQLLRGTMVSRSFIKNVMRPRKKVAPDAPPQMELMTTKKTKTYVKSHQIPGPSSSSTATDCNSPPATYVSNSAVSKSTTTVFKPKFKDRAML